MLISHLAGFNPRFGSMYGLDLGASDSKRGNLRIRTLNDDGQNVGEIISGPVREDGFSKSNDLVAGIAERIQQAQTTNQHLLGKDDAVTSVTIFTPGQADIHSVVQYYENIQDHTGNGLRMVDYKALPGLLEKAGVKVAPNFQIKVANDMMGGIAEALRQLKERYSNIFKPGLSIVYLASGGGLGVAFAEIDANGNAHLRSSEFSHIIDSASGKTLEQSGPSKASLVRNFISQLDLGLTAKQLDEMSQAAPGIIVDDYDIAQQWIPELDKKSFKEATNYAISEYLNALAKLSSIKILEGLNRAVISSPTAKGLKNYMEKNPKGFEEDIKGYETVRQYVQKFYGKQDIHLPAERPVFEKVFLSKVWQQLAEMGKTSFAWNQFDVITDIHVSDNTVGTDLLQKAKVDGRSDRFVLPAAAFKS